MDITGFTIKLDSPYTYEETLERVLMHLKNEGFGKATEMDVKSIFKDKLNRDFARFSILGVCNPQLAYNAITSNPDTSAFLPCNVAVYEEGDKVRIIAMDPGAMGQIFHSRDISSTALEAKDKITRALNEAVK